MLAIKVKYRQGISSIYSFGVPMTMYDCAALLSWCGVGAVFKRMLAMQHHTTTTLTDAVYRMLARITDWLMK